MILFVARLSGPSIRNAEHIFLILHSDTSTLKLRIASSNSVPFSDYTALSSANLCWHSSELLRLKVSIRTHPSRPLMKLVCRPSLTLENADRPLAFWIKIYYLFDPLVTRDPNPLYSIGKRPPPRLRIRWYLIATSDCLGNMRTTLLSPRSLTLNATLSRKFDS